MSDIAKREFSELALNGSNYLTWAFDAEIHLTFSDLSETIVSDSECNIVQKAKALMFLRHHLKNEYLTEKRSSYFMAIPKGSLSSTNKHNPPSSTI